MNLPLFDLIIASIFLFSLIAVSKFKVQLQNESKESYRNIFSGLAIMAFTSLGNVYYQHGLLASIPFISEPLFFKLIYWIGNITGITFLISGLSIWLPLARMFKRYNKDKFKRLEFIKKIEQLSRVENRLNIILEQTLKDMIYSFNLSGGAVFVYSRNKKKMILVSSYTTDENNNIDFTKLEFNANISTKGSDYIKSEAADFISQDSDSNIQPDLVIPINLKNSIGGLFVLSHDNNTELNKDDIVNLKIAVDIISQKIIKNSIFLKEQFTKEQSIWCNKLSQSIDYNKSIDDNIKLILAALKKHLTIDYFNLTIVHDDNVIQRLTSAQKNQGILNEIGVDFLHQSSIAHYVYQTGLSVNIGNLGLETDMIVDNHLLKSDMRSLYAFPVKQGNKLRSQAIAY